MDQKIQKVNNMIMIGATGRNSGKTTLATKIIKKYAPNIPIIAFKLITVHDHEDICPRGGAGCGICKSLKTCYDIKEETLQGTKDTMLLKKAGATHVYLIRSFTENVAEAMEAALKLVPEHCIILCESNSARAAIIPSCFIMIKNTSSAIKPSAEAVIEYADIILPSEEALFEEFIEHQLDSFLI